MKKLSLLLPIVLVTFLSGCSSSDMPRDFDRIAALKSNSASGVNNIRSEALQQTARGLGAQTALAWRSRQINTILNKQKRNLNKIFNFNLLILPNDVLPPILAEGRDTLNLADPSTIRAADRDYQIVFPPRFVTAPPSWRDYIWMNYKKPEAPNAVLLPKNLAERKIWNKYIRTGWTEGVAQADAIFSANIGRLQRDYQGMILYRKLLAQGMVTAPFVSKADLGVTGGGNAMRINDRVLRITSTSELKPNSNSWKPAITKTKTPYSVPKIQLNPNEKI